MTASITQPEFELPQELDTSRLSALVDHILQQMWVDQNTQTAISFVDETEMERLHVEWMDLPGATDVMSFPMDEMKPGSPENITPAGILGDIVICLPVAASQAAAAEHSLQKEVEMLVAHSTLHLLGYDHATPVTEAEMFGLQAQMLTSYYESAN